MEFRYILAVALGGACGSVARYLVAIGSARLFGPSFPWGTLVINIAGSALIGALAGLYATRWDASQSTRLFLTVGICGGFTTFSTFSLDAWYLLERGQTAASLGYMLASVMLSLAALVGAMHLVRMS
jgi:CrcB protein